MQHAIFIRLLTLLCPADTTARGIDDREIGIRADPMATRRKPVKALIWMAVSIGCALLIGQLN